MSIESSGPEYLPGSQVAKESEELDVYDPATFAVFESTAFYGDNGQVISDRHIEEPEEADNIILGEN